MKVPGTLSAVPLSDGWSCPRYAAQKNQGIRMGNGDYLLTGTILGKHKL